MPPKHKLIKRIRPVGAVEPTDATRISTPTVSPNPNSFQEKRRLHYRLVHLSAAPDAIVDAAIAQEDYDKVRRKPEAVVQTDPYAGQDRDVLRELGILYTPEDIKQAQLLAEAHNASFFGSMVAPPISPLQAARDPAYVKQVISSDARFLPLTILTGMTVPGIISGSSWSVPAIRVANAGLATNIAVLGINDMIKNGPKVRNVLETSLATLPFMRVSINKSLNYYRPYLRYKLAKAIETSPINQVDNFIANPEHNIEIFYHGSPYRYNKFDVSKIGSGEGGAKYGVGVNLFSQNYLSAPKFANILSSDAPIHLGRRSIINTESINPTIYTVEGKGLNLYSATSPKKLDYQSLLDLGYDGVRFPLQTTIFPESISKLKFTSPKSISEFIAAHPEVKKWTLFSKEYDPNRHIFMPTYGSFRPKLTGNLPQQLSPSQIEELQTAERLWYYRNFELQDNRVPKLFDLAINHTKTGKSIYPNGYDVMYRGKRFGLNYENTLGSDLSTYNNSVFGWVDNNAELGALSYTRPISLILKKYPRLDIPDTDPISQQKFLFNKDPQLGGILTLVYPKSARINTYNAEGKGIGELYTIPELKWIPQNVRLTDFIAEVINSNPEFPSIKLYNISDLGSGVNRYPQLFYGDRPIPRHIFTEIIYNNRPGQYLKDPHKTIFPDLFNPSTKL